MIFKHLSKIWEISKNKCIIIEIKTFLQKEKLLILSILLTMWQKCICKWEKVRVSFVKTKTGQRIKTYPGLFCESNCISSSVSNTWYPNLSEAVIRILLIASQSSFSRTMTLHLLRSAMFTWKEGFSVVAPIRVIVPSSI